MFPFNYKAKLTSNHFHFTILCINKFKPCEPCNSTVIVVPIHLPLHVIFIIINVVLQLLSFIRPLGWTLTLKKHFFLQICNLKGMGERLLDGVFDGTSIGDGTSLNAI